MIAELIRNREQGSNGVRVGDVGLPETLYSSSVLLPTFGGFVCGFGGIAV